MKGEPKVVLTMSEHNELIRAAGLSPGEHGLFDLKKLLGHYRGLELDTRAALAEDAKVLKRYRFSTLIELIDAARAKR
jgi:hypothetical protein